MELGGRGFRAGRTRFYAARMVKFRGIGRRVPHETDDVEMLLADVYVSAP